MNSTDYELENPYKFFLYVLKKIKIDDKSFYEDISELSEILRINDTLRIKYIKYILNNRYSFTPEKYLFNLTNIIRILTLFQEEAVPLLQPMLMNTDNDRNLPSELKYKSKFKIRKKLSSNMKSKYKSKNKSQIRKWLSSNMKSKHKKRY